MVTVCIIGLLVAALLGAAAPAFPIVLVTVGGCLLGATFLLVRRTASLHIGTAKTLCVLFFTLAAFHMLFGYLLADLTTQHTSIRSNAGIYYANAFLINAAGLLAAGLGYCWKWDSQALVLPRAFAVPVDVHNAERVFRLLLLTGAGLMFFIYWRLGLVEYLSVPAKWPFLRYITSDLAGGSAVDEWLANRAMDLLTVSLPFLVYRAAKHPRVANILPIIVGYFALLLPLRRANLLGVLFASLVLIGIGRHDVYRLTRKWVLIIGCVYILTQCLFLFGVFYSEFDPRTLLAVSSTALPEVRDLAWTMNRLAGERLGGVTFVQALVPLPSIASDWSASHSLRAISTALIGVDQTGESGGLRLTLMGEGYINWGYPGAIAVSLLWGYGVAWCEKLLLLAIRKDQPEFVNYVAVMCFVWICFLFYLAGTQAAAPVKMGALLVLCVGWACKYRSRVLAVPAEARI